MFISGDLVLEGENADETVISAGGRGFRVIHVTADADVIIRKLTIRDGIAEAADWGGGIQNLGKLRLEDVALSDNQAQFGGGLAGSAGSDTLIIDSRITGNRVRKLDAEFSGEGGGLGVFGGTLTVHDTLLEANTASHGGGGVTVHESDVLIVGGRIEGNLAENPLGTEALGGGLVLFSGTLTARDTTIHANSASHGGGGVYNNGNMTLEDVTIEGNSTTKTGCTDLEVPEGEQNAGGGITNQHTLELRNSEILDNQAGCGGGLANRGRNARLTADNILLRFNKADRGGGIYNTGFLELVRGRIWQNETLGSLGLGGGIFVAGDESDMIVRNTDIRGNSNGAIFNRGNLGLRAVGINRNLGHRWGSAITNDYGHSRLRMSESAIFGNSFSGDPDPGSHYAVENHGELDFINVTVAFNSGGGGGGGGPQ